MTYYVVGTLKHDGEKFSNGDEITASDVGGEDNLKVLQARGTVVEDKSVVEVTVPKGQTENSVMYNPRPGPGSSFDTSALEEAAEPKVENVPEQPEGQPVTTQPSAAKAVTKKSGS